MNWRYTTHTGCRNVSRHCAQQSCSGLHSPGRSYSTYLWNDSWFQTFQKQFDVISRLRGLHLEKGKGLSGWRAQVKHGKHARIEKDSCCCPLSTLHTFSRNEIPPFLPPRWGREYSPLCPIRGCADGQGMFFVLSVRRSLKGYIISCESGKSALMVTRILPARLSWFVWWNLFVLQVFTSHDYNVSFLISTYFLKNKTAFILLFDLYSILQLRVLS